MEKLLSELKRRNVFRVAGVYAVAGWLIAQAAIVLETSLKLPDWFDSVVVSFLLLGFPVALILAWAFEMTPEGVKLTAGAEDAPAEKPRRLDVAILAALLLFSGLIVFDRLAPASSETAALRPRQDEGSQAKSPRPEEASARSGEAVSKDAGLPAIDRSKSIAVLPFRDFSPGGDQEWFADGLAEEILNSLARAPDLLVSARTSSFKFKNSDMEIPAIAKELGVAHVLEGSVRRAGDRLRVTAQLIRASDGFHLWSENYDGAQADAISIQEDIAVKIAGALKTAMDPDALAAMAGVGTRSIEAYEAFLESRTLTRSAESGLELALYERALDALKRAVALDPAFAEAQADLGALWAASTNLVGTTPPLAGATPKEAWRHALDAYDAAIAAAPDEGRRQRYAGDRAFMQGRVSDAKREYEAALGAAPNDLGLIDGLARVNVFVGDFDKARAFAARYESLIGADESGISNAIIAYQWSKDYENAARLSRKVLDLASRDLSNLYQAQRSLLWAGDAENARRAAAMFREASAGVSADFINLVEIREACAAGDRASAEKFAAALKYTEGKTNAITYWLALRYLGEDAAAQKMLAPYDVAEPPYRLVDFLYFPFFDASDFPNLEKVIARDGVARPPAVKIPFACPPAKATEESKP